MRPVLMAHRCSLGLNLPTTGSVNDLDMRSLNPTSVTCANYKQIQIETEIQIQTQIQIQLQIQMINTTTFERETHTTSATGKHEPPV